MVVKLVEIAETYDVGATKKYVLREVFVNPEHVICLRPDELAKRKGSSAQTDKDIAKTLQEHINKQQQKIKGLDKELDKAKSK